MFLACVWRLFRQGTQLEGTRDLEGLVGCNYTDGRRNIEMIDVDAGRFGMTCMIWNDLGAVGGVLNWGSIRR
jgi:hypothetical protein